MQNLVPLQDIQPWNPLGGVNCGGGVHHDRMDSRRITRSVEARTNSYWQLAVVSLSWASSCAL